jgi:hypothetical protein
MDGSGHESHSHPKILPNPRGTDGRPCLADQRVDQVSPSLPRSASRIPRALLVDIRVEPIMLSEICMSCLEM